MESEVKIAIQGNRGSFHHVVAKAYNGDHDLVCCETFDATVQALINGSAQQAVMAIENSIAGSIIPNYALIDQHNLKIIGEYNLGIQHELMALPGQQLSELKEVHSHPMALLQCKEFFKQYPQIRLVEAEDTADEARRIFENQLLGTGAIASSEAASLYGMEILASSIQTIKNNITRFVILQTQNPQIEESKIDKAALKFILDHQRGSLAAVLNVMSDCQLNLTKIQSLPVIETPGKYAFFVDITFDDYAHYDKAKQLISIMASSFKILGEYTQFKKI